MERGHREGWEVEQSCSIPAGTLSRLRVGDQRHRGVHHTHILQSTGTEAAPVKRCGGELHAQRCPPSARHSRALVPNHCAVFILRLSSFLPWIVAAGASAPSRAQNTKQLVDSGARAAAASARRRQRQACGAAVTLLGSACSAASQPSRLGGFNPFQGVPGNRPRQGMGVG